LRKGIKREEFVSGLQKALGVNEDTPSESVDLEEPTNHHTTNSVATNAPTSPQAISTHEQLHVPSSAPDDSNLSPSSAPISLTHSAGSQSVESRLETQKRKPPPSSTAVEPDPPLSNARQNWIEQQQQRNAESRRERDRILAQIEADKRARREREKQRKLAAGRGTDLQVEADSRPATIRSAPSRRNPGAGSSTANIQVRMLDGSTIRSTFPATSTPASALRPWIDGSLAASLPSSAVPGYSLKLIQAPPEPAHTLDLSEEQQSLVELGLLPNATLVIVPVTGGVGAYPDGGLVSTVLSLPYNAATGAVGLVGGVVGGALSWVGLGGGDGGHTSRDEPTESRPKAATGADAGVAGARTTRIRTMAELSAENRDGSEDEQFYNGNQASSHVERLIIYVY
jgi:UBX domain